MTPPSVDINLVRLAVLTLSVGKTELYAQEGETIGTGARPTTRQIFRAPHPLCREAAMGHPYLAN